MSAKHTLGPWRLEPVEDRSIKHLCPVAEADNFSLLTVVYSGGHDGDECTAFAAVYRDEDARLIAAAPELLEALQTLTDHCRRMGFDTREEEPLLQAAEAAIAKATGEAA